MAASADIFTEREPWAQPLAVSTLLHAGLFGAIFLYAAFAGGAHGEDWGGFGAGEGAMSATLVSKASVPLPAPVEETQNVLANESAGLSQSPPPQAEQAPEAVPIPEREKKPEKKDVQNREKPRPPIEDNRIPFGQGGPVSAPYAVFSAPNARGGISVSGGDFGSRYAWYVDKVRRVVSENWLKYEVDPNIYSAKRVYIVFEITRGGEPENVRLEQSSGVPSLDQSAVRALQRIDSFGPLPEGYAGERVSVEFWFDYRR